MAINEDKTQTISQSYDYIFLSDLLEMVRSSCCIVRSDKTLSSLFTAVINHIDTCLPDIEGEIIDLSVSATIIK